MRRVLVVLTALATALALAMPAFSAAEDTPVISPSGDPVVEEGEFDSYVVLMRADPLVVSEGRDNLRTGRAQDRGEQMRADHDRVMRDSGVAVEKKVSDYVYALNGFAAHVTHAEATRLAKHPDVAIVVPDELMQTQTDSSPSFLGLDGPTGPWRTGVTGEGTVVGIIDTGIWPEHPSFAENGLPAPPIAPLQDLVVGGPEGPYQVDACDFGNTGHNPNDEPFVCNNKLVGARQVLPSYRQLIGAEDFEFDSARDDDGHGTHVAGTAAGNRGVDASVFGNDLGDISGVAPDAHIIAYKGLGSLGGFGSDLALAIDIAVFDGVDVINYSVGGSQEAITVDEIAFLFAADAGVHIASSAGNSGPGPATVRNPAKVPWLTTVGANTQTRFWQGTIELGDGTVIEGASVTRGIDGVAPLVDGEAAGDDLCRLNTLDDEVVEGAVVLCRRGAPARIMSSAEVERAGGVGIILYNDSDVDNLFTDSFSVPGVMIDNTPGLEIKDYIASAGADAAVELTETATASTWPAAPSMAIFSSRGPNVFADVLKPDVTAPGFQIVAGNSPFPTPITVGGDTIPRVQGELFQSIGGTSMSSPHVAGMFALLKQANPDWSAAVARSAIMTTAHTDVVDNDRQSQATPFGMGAGHLQPGGAHRPGSSFQPGLAYDAGLLDYFGFLCDVAPEVFADPEATCASLAGDGIPTEASNLNYPSISVSELVGEVTLTRTVTSVARERAPRTYRASVEAPSGFSVSVEPASFTLRPGESQTFEMTIVNESAPAGEWRFGSLTWIDNTRLYEVRSPIAVNASDFSAPAEITGDGVDGTADFEVRFGYDGDYSATGHGLEPATVTTDNVQHDPAQSFDPGDPEASLSNSHQFDLDGVDFFRIALPPDSVDDPGHDLDVYVFDPDGDLVAASFVPGTDELVDIANPGDGTWTVWVHGWLVVDEDGEPGGDTDYDLYTWEVSQTAGGSLVIEDAPDSATASTTGTVEISWSEATAGEWHLGAVLHRGNGGALLARTLVSVDNRDLEPPEPEVEADLAITKSAEEEDGEIHYTLEVTNLGPDDATGVVVTDDLPDEVTYLSDTCEAADLSPWTWEIGELEADATVDCVITVEIDSSGEIVNTATVTGNEDDPDPDNNTASATVVVEEPEPEVCDDIITGRHTGPLTISEGITCLEDATVTGPVTVQAGAGLISVGSRITGPVSSNGASEVTLCDTRVTGPLNLVGSSKVVVGDPDDDCEPNNVIGPVNVTGTAGPSVIAGNRILGPLSCSGNDPAPVNNGFPNDVTGPKSGQCEDL